MTALSDKHAKPSLFHMSEELGIERFEPRMSEYAAGSVVWAIEARRLCNYLVPRECPRVTYYAGNDSSAADVKRLLGSRNAVVAIERGWLERLRSSRLYCYHMPSQTFECLDECAGYFVSRVPVVPLGIEVVEDPLGRLLKSGVELRVLSSLWELRDAVVASSLRYSMIRMRNASPRATA